MLSKHLGKKSVCLERTSKQAELDHAYSPVEKNRRETHRKEWRRRWGFLPEEGGQLESDLEWLESELNKHLPRVTHRGEPIEDIDSKRLVSPEIKLILVLDYHMWVAPMALWKMYFEALRKNASF